MSAGKELLRAATQGHVTYVRELIERGTNVNVQDNNGVSPLMLAAYNGHATTVELLLTCGADLKIQTGYGLTALKAAKMRDHTAVIKLLNGFPATAAHLAQ